MKFKLIRLNEALTVSEVANIHFFEFPEDFYTEFDSHPFWELVYVSSGSLMIRSESYNGPLEKGELILHPANRVHALNSGEQHPTVIIAGFTLIGKGIEKFTENPIRLNDYQVSCLSQIVKLGRTVFLPPYDIPTYEMKKRPEIPFGSEQLLKTGLERLMIDLVTSESPGKSEEVGLSFDVGQVVDYLDENYREKLILDELAFIFGTNRSTLCREFKRSTGSTINEYVNEKRLCRAKQLILETDRNYTQIATDLNFSSVNYFSIFFKSRTGMSPGEYRRALAEKEMD